MKQLKVKIFYIRWLQEEKKNQSYENQNLLCELIKMINWKPPDASYNETLLNALVFAGNV